MLDQLKKAILGIMGAAVTTPEELREIVDRLVREDILSSEQGQKLYDALLQHRQKVPHGQKDDEARGKKDDKKDDKRDDTAERVSRELHRLLGLVPLVTRAELHRLEERVRRIEERLGLEPQAPDEVPGSGGESGGSA